MRIASDVLKELLGMFATEAKLTLATLFLVAGVAGLVVALRVGPILDGGILLFGCLGILVEAVSREARARYRQ